MRKHNRSGYPVIKVKQIKMEQGKFTLQVEYDGFFQGTRLIQIDVDEVRERLKQSSRVLGRRSSKQDLKDVIKALIQEARETGAPVEQPFALAALVEVDLEAEK